VEDIVSAPARKRIRPNRDARTVVGSPRDLEVLASLAWAGYLTTGQLERLHFPSRRRAQRRLRALLDHGLVRAHLQAGALDRENVYLPTPLALDRLAETQLFPDGPPTLARMPRVSKLAHGIAIRSVFVEAVLWERAGAGWSVDVLFEGELSRDAGLRAAGIIPDLLVVVDEPAPRRELFVEVDLGTETTTTLRAKFAAWSAYLASRSASSVRLALVAMRDGRLRTLERLADEAGLAARIGSALLPDAGRLLADGWPQAPAAAPGRTERRTASSDAPDSSGPPASSGTAFRARRS
jgi:hypothetical protein